MGVSEAIEHGQSVEDTLVVLLPKVRGWMHRILGPGAALDDAVQDALIAIAQALPRFRGDASVETFAYRITVRVSYKALASRGPPARTIRCPTGDST